MLGDSPATESLVAAATRSFPSETESLGFRNNADYLGVSTLVAQGYADAAEQFLEPIAANTSFLPCSLAMPSVTWRSPATCISCHRMWCVPLRDAW